jgi:predicted PurR-regulated permease PerM
MRRIVPSDGGLTVTAQAPSRVIARPRRLTARNRGVTRHQRQTVAWRPILQGASAISLGIAVPVLVWLLIRPLALLLLAIVLAEALSPLVRRLERWLPRLAAIAAIYGAIALVVAGVGWLAIPRLVDQGQLLVERGPELLDQAKVLVNQWDPGGADRILDAAQNHLDRVGGWIVDIPVALVSTLVEIVLVLFLSAYWLISAPALHRFVRSLLPPSRRDEVSDVIGEMGQAMGGYVRGVVIDAVIMGALAYLGLLLVGFDYPLVGGLVTMVGELVPVVGPIAAAVPIVAIGFLDSPTMALSVLVLYVVLQQFEGHLLTPNIMRSQTHVSQVLTLFALFAGGALGGILGALVAIPLAGAVRVFVLRVGAPAVRRWTGAPTI